MDDRCIPRSSSAAIPYYTTSFNMWPCSFHLCDFMCVILSKSAERLRFGEFCKSCAEWESNSERGR